MFLLLLVGKEEVSFSKSFDDANTISFKDEKEKTPYSL
jgi:hypothetical protein